MKKSLLVIGLTLAANAHAGALGWIDNVLDINQNLSGNLKGVADKGTYVRGLKENHDDITPDQDAKKLKLNKQELHQAKVWNLSKDEEKRYVFLMQNRSGLYYKNLKVSPVEVLGANARTDQERAYYADLAARQEVQYVSKNLAWNEAFHRASSQLMRNVPVMRPFDVRPFSPLNFDPIKLQQGDQLVLFVKPNTDLSASMVTLVSDIKKTPDTALNIYVAGYNVNDAKIQSWARDNAIPVKLVNDHKITLNFGNDKYKDIKLANKSMPLLIKIRGGQASKVNLSEV